MTIKENLKPFTITHITFFLGIQILIKFLTSDNYALLFSTLFNFMLANLAVGLLNIMLLICAMGYCTVHNFTVKLLILSIYNVCNNNKITLSIFTSLYLDNVSYGV